MGVKVLKQLKWDDTTRLRFQWGKEEHLFLLRIIRISNPEVTGWIPRIFKAGHANITNRSLPKDMVKVNRNIEIPYGIKNESGNVILQLKLPDNFYPVSLLKNQPTKTHSEPKVLPTLKSVQPLVKKEIVKPTTIRETSIDTIVRDGGIITVEQLCKYLRIYNGDTATYTNEKNILLNEKIVSMGEALQFANTVRVRVGKPIFHIRVNSL